uniref:PUM-HD domain-containing protein n=1 Tax=Ananas comosus var. bracteatus TaxID=296719 RepID=A0A6V7Q442_ANACO|nr:unnamed protein product [Ananas comosus var. bracteatus]
MHVLLLYVSHSELGHGPHQPHSRRLGPARRRFLGPQPLDAVSRLLLLLQLFLLLARRSLPLSPLFATPPNHHPSPSPHPFPANADSYHPRQFASLYTAFAAINADSYHRRQFAPLHTASSDSRLHRIPAQTIQLLNLSLLHGDYKYVAVFFPTVLNEVKNLILDRHDFRFLERFINACDELQRAKLLAAVAADTRTLLRICCDKNGSAILATLIKYSRSWEQISHILRALSPFILDLAKGKTGSDILKNYLVQHLLEKRIWPLTSGILQTLRGHFANLSTQKYSSNVVENCLKNTTSDERESIIRELLWSPNILDIFVDLYGNYVMQTALSVAKGGVHKELLDLLKKNLPTLSRQGPVVAD